MWICRVLLFGFFSWMLILSALGQSDVLLAANQAYDSGNYESVIQSLEPLGDQKHDVNSLMLLADAKQKTGDFESAIEVYNKAAQLDNSSEKMHTHRASAHIWSGNYGAAAKDLDKALSIDDSNYLTWYYLGVNEYYRMKIRPAIRALDRCIELQNGYAPAWYLRGACRAELGQTSQAIDDYTEALARDKSLIEASFNIAVLKFENKDYLEAREDFTQLLTEMPEKKAEILYYKAESAYFSNDKQEACNDYYEAMQLGDELSKEIYDKYCLKNENRKNLPSRKTQSISL